MKSFLVLALGLYFVDGQYDNVCNDTCLYPASPSCKRVSIYSQGVDPFNSPYYGFLTSSQSTTQYGDSRCSTFFQLTKNLFLLVNTLVRNDGSYRITKILRGDITNSPGAYRLEALTTNDCPTCVINDYILMGLNGSCQGTYVLYRCLLYGDCADQDGSEFVVAFSSALQPFPVPSSCQSEIESIVRQQGLGSVAPLLYNFPNKLGHRCVTRINGLTAINAQCVAPENSVEINDNNICY